MINIDLFENNLVEDFTLVLANRQLDKQGKLANVKDFIYSGKLNDANEISFTLYKELDGKIEDKWDDVYDFKLVWLKEADEYFQITLSKNESTSTTKKVIGKSLCEAELSQTIIRNLEVNSESDIERDDYSPTKFCDFENPQYSLVHRVISYAPHYRIKYIDKSLNNLQRTFSVNDKTVYDFFTGECAEQFGCIFQFNSKTREISAYDLNTVCDDCGNRGEFNGACPNCGGKNLHYFGEDTTIFVEANQLTEEVTFETNTDNVKNCFKLKSGDEIMDAAIIACNPNGSDYLYYFSDEQKRDMPEELKCKMSEYDNLVNEYQERYQSLSKELYDCIDKILYYQSSMMPNIEISDTNATTEARKLTSEILSPIGLSSLSKHTSIATVNSAIKNFAKTIVKSGFVKLDIDSGAFAFIGVNEDGIARGGWSGRIKVENYADEEDIAYTDMLSVTITSDYETFLDQKVKKILLADSDDNDNVYDVLKIENYDVFVQAIKLYSYNRLESFYNAIQGVINVLIEERQSGIDDEYYSTFYEPYYNKLQACQSEMNVRAATIHSFETREEEIIKEQTAIRETLNMRAFFGEDLYKLFCSYRREDTYSNENFISDGLDNAQIFENAKEFLALAKKEIVKSGEHQHSISANLYNLFMIEKFKPFREKFQLGNWIRVKIDEKVYKLRFIGYEVTGRSLKNINTEFSDLVNIYNGTSDIKDILDQSQSMASSYQYVSKQANKGSAANDKIENLEEYGLKSAKINITNNNREEVTYDNHGIICKSWDDVEENYTPDQLRLTHNILAFTEDNWKTVSLGLGRHKYKYFDIDKIIRENEAYGLSARFVQAGHVYGSQIIGGEIFSTNYSPTTGTYLDLVKGSFSFAGGKLSYNVDTSKLIMRGVNVEWDSTTTPEITDINGLSNQFDSIASDLNQLDGKIDTAVNSLDDKVTKILAGEYKTTIGEDYIISPHIGGGDININNRFKVDSQGNVTLPSNASISWSQVTGTNDVALKSNIPTKTSQLSNDSGYQNSSQVTQITKNTITTSYINALNVEAGSVKAENIIGNTINGKTIIVGGQNNGDGSFVVKDKDGNIIVTIDANGITVAPGALTTLTKQFIVLSGSVLADLCGYNGFIIQDNSLFSECKAKPENDGDEVVKFTNITNIDMTGYSKMTVVSTAYCANPFGSANVKWAIDEEGFIPERLFFDHSQWGTEGKVRTHILTIDISGYNGRHTLKFRQSAITRSSVYETVVNLGLNSIVLET